MRLPAHLTQSFGSLICRIGLISLIGLIAACTAARPTLASDVSLVVSPPRFDIEGKPGDTVQKTITVTNNSTSQTLSLKTLTRDFIVQDDVGTPVLVTTSASGRYLASPWFTVDRDSLTVPPKGQAQLIVIIQIPKDALPGGHYAGIFFQPVPPGGLKTNVSYVSSQVGSLFGITVAGNIKYGAVIKDFKVGQSLYEFGPVSFTTTIENQSDTHISPKVDVKIHDLFGRELADTKLDAVNIFPFTSRTLSGQWDTVWGLGRYSATLTAAYGPNGDVATRTILFWILPYRLLAAAGVILLVALAIFILIRRHVKHREDTRDQEIDELKRKIVELENR